jgi:phenylalanyl-tRNA synthetase alpha chain
MKLSEAQVAVLEAASANEAQTIDDIAKQSGLEPENVTRAAFGLSDTGLIELADTTQYEIILTEEGAEYSQRKALPEHILYKSAIDAGADEHPVSIGDIIDQSNLDDSLVDIALSNFARKGYGTIKEGRISADPAVDISSDKELDELLKVSEFPQNTRSGTAIDVADDRLEPEDHPREAYPESISTLERRGLLEYNEDISREIILTDDGVTALMEGVETADTVGQVTPELLTTGEWSDVEFADYNVEADAERVDGGRMHVLRRTAERVKDVLVGMGFREMDGPHVDADFWINDCLFMPQDHPARTHWGRFEMDNPVEIDDLPEELVESVRAVHLEGTDEEGEGYHSPWDESFARKLALRGHTTSLSARYLSDLAVGELEPPQRFFSVEKAYRNDTLDATHLLEFFQIEGWVMAEDLSVRDLMGTFTEFYEQFGITDLRFKPTYNPYTEPSFELFGEHPRTGELIEIGNSGLFRPEMLSPLGVDCDVMAWGLALERLLMLTHGFEDIRDVHGTLVDLDFLRNAEVVY